MQERSGSGRRTERDLKQERQRRRREEAEAARQQSDRVAAQEQEIWTAKVRAVLASMTWKSGRRRKRSAARAVVGAERVGGGEAAAARAPCRKRGRLRRVHSAPGLGQLSPSHRSARCTGGTMTNHPATAQGDRTPWGCPVKAQHGGTANDHTESEGKETETCQGRASCVGTTRPTHAIQFVPTIGTTKPQPRVPLPAISFFVVPSQPATHPDNTRCRALPYCCLICVIFSLPRVSACKQSANIRSDWE